MNELIVTFLTGIAVGVICCLIINPYALELIKLYKEKSKADDRIQAEYDAFIEALFSMMEASAAKMNLIFKVINNAKDLDELRDDILPCEANFLDEVEEVKRSYYGEEK